MKRLIALTLFVCSLGLAQTREYVVPYTADLTATAAIVTVQQPASGGAGVVRFSGLYIYCSVACNFTLERTGTAATATAATPVPLNSTTTAARTTAFTASNVGSGTTLGTYSLLASTSKSFDLAGVALFGNGTAKNFTVRTNAITGTVQVVIQFKEDN